MFVSLLRYRGILICDNIVIVVIIAPRVILSTRKSYICLTSGMKVHNSLRIMKGSAMAQAVSRRPLTAESRVRTQINPCEICGGQSVTGTDFFSSSSVFTLSIQFHRLSPYSYIIRGIKKICSLLVAVQRRSLTPSKSTMRILNISFILIYCHNGFNLIPRHHFQCI
jgi:hypothetical protein